MKIIDVKKLLGTDREVHCPFSGFISNRILLESDGMGFTLTKTVIPRGDWQFWHYKNHLEACYCVSGHGVLKLKDKPDIEHKISAGVTYILDEHDAHFFRAVEDVVLICVFNPPLTGKEVHDKDGSYTI